MRRFLYLPNDDASCNVLECSVERMERGREEYKQSHFPTVTYDVVQRSLFPLCSYTSHQGSEQWYCYCLGGFRRCLLNHRTVVSVQ